MNRRDAVKLMGAGGLGLYLASRLSSAKALNSILSGNDLTKEMFGKDFKWGTATAAYQIEGAYNIDGKGESIWDRFTANPKHVKTRENGNVACDFYHLYKTDLRLMKEMNFGCFRFSTAWARILPEGIGKVNQNGLDFYHHMIDFCLELGIEPWLTLYHWDLPQALQDKGGWVNRDVISWFNEYTDVVTCSLGGKVKNWMVLNEPVSFIGGGYLGGIHPPGHINLKEGIAASHHAVLCQAEGARVIRANVPGANIGTTFSCAHIDPKNTRHMHEKAAAKLDALSNRLFIEPALGMGYPTDVLPFFKKVEKYMKDGDEQKMKFDFDFIGLQNYTRFVARFALIPPVIWGNIVPAKKVTKEVLNEMGWEIYPKGIYEILKQFSKYPIKTFILTENGVAVKDKVEDGKVHDARRTQFFKDYLAYVLKAKNEGINVNGYFVWSLMDNFEWAEGYRPKLGLVAVDFKTQQRIIKDSGLWFKEFLK